MKMLSKKNKELLKSIALDGEVETLNQKQQLKTHMKGSLHWEGKESYMRLTISAGRVNMDFPQLRDALLPEGYYPYISDMPSSSLSRPYEISIIPFSDQYDVLREEETEAPNHDLDTQAIIDQLKMWNQEYGIDVVGAGDDWVYFMFKELPDDLDLFIKEELFAFCPDFIEQGKFADYDQEEAMSLEADVISYQKMINLWWD